MQHLCLNLVCWASFLPLQHAVCQSKYSQQAPHLWSEGWCCTVTSQWRGPLQPGEPRQSGHTGTDHWVREFKKKTKRFSIVSHCFYGSETLAFSEREKSKDIIMWCIMMNFLQKKGKKRAWVPDVRILLDNRHNTPAYLRHHQVHVTWKESARPHS